MVDAASVGRINDRLYEIEDFGSKYYLGEFGYRYGINKKLNNNIYIHSSFQELGNLEF